MTQSAQAFSRYLTLRSSESMILIDAPAGGRARFVYAGPDLGSVDPVELESLATRQHAAGGPETPIAASALNTIGTGHPSPPGLLAHAQGQHWAIDPRVRATDQKDDQHCGISTLDQTSGLAISHDIRIDPQSGVATIFTVLINEGETPISLEWCAAACLPLDPRLTRIAGFTGKWAGEFQTENHELVRGSFVRENRAGRTGHDCFPGFYLGTDRTSEAHGLACAIHLGWSGNHRLRLDRLADDTLSLQAGDLLLPGEITLDAGQTYTTPEMHICLSGDGYGDVTRRLHRFVRSRAPNKDVSRPVHYNTWEAVYFDHSPEKLMALADQAAAVGAERFVLDDGWFGARRSDRAGLGDWFVSKEIYPDGLKPLADHVRSLGMEFGLWLEPEMVNPDSDLYRAHPDWVLRAEGAEPIPSRHQLALDLTREDVVDYLFERIDTLIRQLGIAYIKWDMNRDIQHPGNSSGRATMSLQTHKLYALMHSLRHAHPELVIESCSSGGARADYAILGRTDRIWTSDNNDARMRHAIMRGAGYFLPLEVLGNHVGPKRCHITGRQFDMAFRAGTAIFGHMGMELDLSGESETDRAILAEAIALHKKHRALIHSGDYHRLEVPDHISGISVAASDGGEAIFQIAVLDQHPAPHPPRIFFAGLAPQLRYRLECIWPQNSAKALGVFTGAALVQYGLQLPQTFPDTCLIYYLKAEN